VYDDPCVFKRACKKCNFVEKGKRPTECIALKCMDYTPCKKCGGNKLINSNNICRTCESGVTESILRKSKADTAEDISDQINKEMNIVKKRSNITIPGTPPRDYDETEVEYYTNQWNEYFGYYTDPTMKPIIHHIILIEVELNKVSYQILNSRKADQDLLISKRTVLLKNLELLRKQLPEESARNASKEETALSLIYDKYIEESEKSNKGGIKRIFDTPTIALAPVLRFPADLTELLEKCGYEVIDISKALSVLKDLPRDPVELAEFFGFPVSVEDADKVGKKDSSSGTLFIDEIYSEEDLGD
jgi:hypothetical protein